MSDTTDDMEAQAGVYEAQMESWEHDMEEPVWRTKAGVLMDIEDMETSHIQNCIRMLERKVASRPDPYAWGEPEGDAAQDAFNSEIRHNDYLEELFLGKIKQFKRELKIRGVVYD